MIELRYYQAESTPAVREYIHKKKGNPIVALPTGAGKTYCIADLVKYFIKVNRKVVILSHVREILEQNHGALEDYLGIKVSLNSSMMGRREFGKITVAGIQSVHRQSDRFKGYVVIIDEAHLVSNELTSMYRTFINSLDNPLVVGFTATPYRLGDGYIYGKDPELLFSGVALDYCTEDKFNKLVDEGYLCKLTTKRTEYELDTSGIKLQGGDFKQDELSDRFDRSSVTEGALKEVLAAGRTRKKWLIFAIDIDHAEHIAEFLIRNGIPTGVVHSKMHESGFDRQKTIEGLGDGRYKCIVNVNILTTGFDDRGIDLIATLRPTHSPTLHVQSLGRGSRIEAGKEDCLVLDFAGNTARLGPINNPVVLKRKKGTGGDPITKECPDCRSILSPAVRVCPDCGFKFKFEHGISATAANIDVVNDGKAHWLRVDGVTYSKNSNLIGPSTVKITYSCRGVNIAEWVCVEHKGFAKHKADHWVKFRGGSKCNSADDFMSQSDTLTVPSSILVQKKSKYYTIKDAKF